MRTTLNIDDDLLAAAKERARREGTTVGEVVSALLREAMTRPAGGQTSGGQEPAAHYGFRPFASRGRLVTDETVNRLRDREGL